jgi:diaminopimelate epimerase
MRFAKGHGTGNDFVILPDPDGAIELTPELTRRLCDRRTGIGADGLLRAVRAGGGSAEWFMDYRNADGSVAEMCGNGIRVLARYLLARGSAEDSELLIGTRAGTRRVWPEPGGQITVDMGPVRRLGTGVAIVGGRRCDGVAVWAGNPHLACLTKTPLAEFDLSAPPATDPEQFPHGVNVELVRLTGERLVEMRVFAGGAG